ncbi:MAG TPA: tetratricopeptide repeat protein, partial [Pyrinomonadaceae bacterium]|nr:tetratricopeptide repeat protein [Pyrinomonadaceae bacterium]
YESFRPYRPLHGGDPADFKGYFQPGADVNHIVVPLALAGEDSQVVQNHEAVHLLLAATARRVPDWLNEGLAQYYSTLRVSDGGATLGAPVARHAALLRQARGRLMPPARLFQIDRGSRDYRAGAARDLFYAQSWALVHYLASTDGGRGHLRLFRFLEMLASGMELEESFRRAFGLDYAALESRLPEYVRRGEYATRELRVGGGASGEAELKSTPLTEAEAQFYLGDLLLHVDQFAAAEAHLRRALALDRASARAHASLGMALARQRRFAAARQSLRRAVALAPDNFLAHYYHAYALSREDMEDGQTATEFSPEVAEEMRAALERAVALEPRFPESYRLLAFVNLVTGERLDEAVELLSRGLALAPNRPDLLFVLAQVHLRRGDAPAAREALAKVAAGNAGARLRARAESLLRATAGR